MVTCGFCGSGFEEDRGQPTCMGCPLGATCGMVRCPACGYENPAAPPWVTKLKTWMERRKEAGASSPSSAGDATEGPVVGPHTGGGPWGSVN